MTAAASSSIPATQTLSFWFRPAVQLGLLAIGCGAGLVLSVAVFRWLRTWENDDIRADFQLVAEQRVAAVKDRANNHLAVIESLYSFFAATEEIDRPQFHELVSHLLGRYGCIQAIEWAPRVADSARPEFEAAAPGAELGLAQGFKFQITEQQRQKVMVRAARRPEYFPVFFMEPRQGNEAAIGFDLASNSVRREAMERARDTGEATASARIMLVQETGNQYGVLIFHSVYRHGAAITNVADRRRNLKGFLLIVCRIGDLVENSLANLTSTDEELTVLDDSSPPGKRFLYLHSPRRPDQQQGPLASSLSTDPENLAARSAFSRQATVDVAGRQWNIISTPATEFIASRRTWQPWGGLAAGLLLTGLLAAYLTALTRRSVTAQRLVGQLEAANLTLGRSQAKLSRSEGQYRSVVDNIGIGVTLLSPDMKVLALNKQMRTWYPKMDVAQAPLCYRSFNDPPRDQPCTYCPVRRTLADGQVHEAVTDTPSPRGTLNFRIVASPVTDQEGKVVAAIELVEDVTERRQLELQFAQSQKMEAFGLLAGGIAHDFRNQLTVIKGYGEMLQDAALSEQNREAVQEIITAADRSAELTGELLTFSRKQMLRPEVTNLNDTLDGMAKSLRRMIGEDVRLSIVTGPNLGNVKVDPGQFRQALVNLAVNARDAMPKGGQLSITTGNADLDESFVRQHLGASPGPHVVVTVRDTGVGMDRETLARVFEPFFTTKPVGQGTGLGLAMVYGFVRQSGGYVDAQSQLGQGAAFSMYLPRTGESPAPAESADVHEGLAPGTETILLVEDEDAIRHVLASTLRKCGYTVLEAAGVKEAMPLSERYEGRIDLLLTDVIMPEVDGAVLADMVTALRPGTKVLFMSGYTGNALTNRGLSDLGGPGQADLLVKPFSMPAFTQAVRRALAKVKKSPANQSTELV